MLKKRIKAMVIACVLICILPIKSNGLDQEEFLRFLINSSYPETNVNESEPVSENNNKKESIQGKSENVVETEKEYIKVHVGEENIPDLTSTSNSKSTVTNLNYKEDMLVTKESPRILIYHTHGAETYSNSPEGNYHSKDIKNSVMEVGSLLTTELSEKGWGVVHTTKYHDYPSYNNSYSSSLKTIQEIIPKYSSINIAIDLHRDAKDLPDAATKEKENKNYTTTINGQKVAKFFFVVGAKNDNLKEIKNLAQSLTNLANEKYPGIALPIVEKTYGKYNQFVAKNHMLIEIGSNATSVEEAKASTKYIANILDEYFK